MSDTESMVKRSSKKSKRDVAQNALRVVEELIGAPLANKKMDKKSLIRQLMSEMGGEGR